MSDKHSEVARKVFVLYDGRALTGISTDECAVLSSANSEQEAWNDSRIFRGVAGLWFEYELVKGIADKEKPRPDIGKGILLQPRRSDGRRKAF